MKAQPFTIIEPQIERLVDGYLSRLYRPIGGRLADIRPGALLWVREPFHLPLEFDHISSAQAQLKRARPTFVTDVEGVGPGLGRRRFARELLRDWHRQHLQVIWVGHALLQSITIDEIRAQGFTHTTAFARAWNQNLSLSKKPCSWDANPEVLVMDFVRVEAPVPAKAAI
ncbi:hypothetical protein [Novosphingobium sp. KA1]|uniref:hypothetical protein n=1 Tax=Novosphingobium sp. (strain KA1) TaxID=164608 RepID=UPI001A907E30|nr:hypothetical protein [Novosphingobium sp. KA1]QSR16030.1 hypothetical protein CA833_02265 [Novosphingobium sp. KA1]